MGNHSIYILSRNMKNIRVFLSENFQFLVVKFSIYLNRRVFEMSVKTDQRLQNAASDQVYTLGRSFSIISDTATWSKIDLLKFFSKYGKENVQKLRVNTVVLAIAKPVWTLIMKTCLLKYIENITTKNWKFSDTKLIFFIFLLKT